LELPWQRTIQATRAVAEPARTQDPSAILITHLGLIKLCTSHNFANFTQTHTLYTAADPHRPEMLVARLVELRKLMPRLVGLTCRSVSAMRKFIPCYQFADRRSLVPNM
jgi:hypothetical protein